jgi:4-amino-4-deoxy-L-arabinose transferase-like glycosyltransferase
MVTLIRKLNMTEGRSPYGMTLPKRANTEAADRLASFLYPKRQWVAFALIIAGALALTLYRLGACGVCKGNESVEAVFIQQMVERGEVLFPSVNGGSPMYKPPLYHWTAAALDRIAGVGKVTPFNFRLPSALYTTAGVALTMGFAYGLLSIDGAILAGVSLLAAHQYVRLGRFGRVDMSLTFFETLALFAFWWWFERLSEHAQKRRDAMLYLAAIAIGLAVLAKGPVGAIIPGLAITIFMLLEGRLREVLRPAMVGPALVAIVIGASWYVAGYLGAKRALLDRQISSENFGRFFGALGSSPPWYYLAPLLLNSLPVSLLVPFAVYGALFRARGSVEPEWDEGERTTRAGKAVKLLAIFWLVTVAFFSLAAYKSRWYVLPLWPAAAVVLAWWIQRLDIGFGRGRIKGAFAAVCVAVAAFNLFFIPHQEWRDCERYGYRATAADIRRLVAPSEPLYATGFVDEDFAPLLFYLDRDAQFIPRDLAKAPPGYIIVPAELWQAQKEEAHGFEPILQSPQGRRKPVLLRHLPN